MPIPRTLYFLSASPSLGMKIIAKQAPPRPGKAEQKGNKRIWQQQQRSTRWLPHKQEVG
jgi:hypothetical protein